MIVTQPYQRTCTDTFYEKYITPSNNTLSLYFSGSTGLDLNNTSSWSDWKRVGNTNLYVASASFPIENSDLDVSKLKVTNVDVAGHTHDTDLRVCTKLIVKWISGEYVPKDQYVFAINGASNKHFKGNYVELVNISGSKAVNVPTKYRTVAITKSVSGNKEFFIGSNVIGESSKVKVTFLPEINQFDVSDYNPLQNNVVENRDNTYATTVDIIHSGSKDIIQTASVAQIPDSYFTSIANLSGRYLGTKNNYYTKYFGDKVSFRKDLVKACIESVSYNPNRGIPYTVEMKKVDRSFLQLQEFSGSILPKDTNRATVNSLLSSGISLKRLMFTTTTSIIQATRQDLQEFTGNHSGSFGGFAQGTLTGKLIGIYTGSLNGGPITASTVSASNATVTGTYSGICTGSFSGSFTGSYQEFSSTGIPEGQEYFKVLPLNDYREVSVTGSTASGKMKVKVYSSLPREGTVLYNPQDHYLQRIPNASVYCPDLGALLETDVFGQVTYVSQIEENIYNYDRLKVRVDVQSDGPYSAGSTVISIRSLSGDWRILDSLKLRLELADSSSRVIDLQNCNELSDTTGYTGGDWIVVYKPKQAITSEIVKYGFSEVGSLKEPSVLGSTVIDVDWIKDFNTESGWYKDNTGPDGWHVEWKTDHYEIVEGNSDE